MASRVRTHDWSATPLGAIDSWAAELKAATMLVLDTGFPAALVWGEKLTTIYNDAFIPILGGKPDALGQSFAHIWGEVWDEIGPIARRAFAGEATFIADYPLLIRRSDQLEQAYFTFAYSPVRGFDGTVVGMLDIVTETTVEVLARQALQESEARFRAFVAASSDAVYRMGPDWSQMRQLEGRKFLPDTVEPNDFWLDRYIHPSDQPAVHAAITRAIDAKSNFEFDHRVIRSDGSLGWTLSRAVPVFGEDGEIDEWLGTATDITAAKDVAQAEAEAEAAAEKDERRQALMVRLADSLRSIGEVQNVANAACRLLADYLGASRVQFTAVEGGPGAEMGEIRGEHVRSGVAMPRRFPFAPFGRSVLEVLQAGEPLILADIDQDPRLDETQRRAFRAAASPAAIFIPLLRQQRLVAMLSVHAAKPREWTRSEATLIGEVAGLTWDGFEHARVAMALRASEERFRQFGEASQDILWSRDAETFQWDYLTPAFETIYGIDRASALRGDNMAGWIGLIVPEDRERASASLRRVHEGEWVTFEYRIRRPSDGSIRWLRETDFPIKDDAGRIVRIGGIGHDITGLKAAEDALAAAEQRQRALLEGIPQLVWRAVDGGEWTWVSPQWTEYTGQSARESLGWGWLDPLHPEDRDKAREAWSMAIEAGGIEIDYRIRHAGSGEYRWFTSRAVPVRESRETSVEWFGTSTDVDELRRLQDLQKTLLAELQHRVRNILAVIRSMMRRSSEGQESLGDYVQHLEGRLSALARTQVLLTRAVDARVDIEDLIREELLAQAADENRISLSGPVVALGAKAAEVMSLAVHELTTNSVKYGALSRPAATLDIQWKIEDRSGLPWLDLTWSEIGVAVAATAPRHQGFGTELVTRRIPYELKGAGTLEMRPGGIHCRLEFPLRDRASILQTNAGSNGIVRNR